MEAIFHRASGMPAAARPAFLDRICGTDSEMRSRVDRMLAEDARPSTRLGTPALAAVSADLACALDPRLGSQVGAYRIVARIAEGGMGVVYRAERADDQFKKTVAVKLVRRGMVDAEQLRRFRIERETLARLEHPNIARLLDGGVTPEGDPFLVMEYVEGEPIDTYCDRRRLSTSSRLELFRTVCSAVDHAHRNLVVHRDLKPRNILVTEDGTPKLLDFGIAKVLGPDLDAASSALTLRPALTPHYASPEQVRLEPVTTASDVYSLGVVLYELLTGRRPYRVTTGSVGEIERSVLETDPVRPSSVIWRFEDIAVGPDRPPATPEDVSRVRDGTPRRLSRRLQGDLDNIVLKAMRKEPHRRYASVAKLSEDLECYLTNRPVSARADTVVYRAAKFVRRRTTLVVASVLVALSLAAGIGGVALEARVAARERDAAESIASFLDKVLSSADPARKGPDYTVAAALDNAAARIDTELAGRPRVRVSLHGTVGRAYFALGLYGRAEKHLRAALDVHRASNDSEVDRYVGCVNALASVLHARGAFAEAEELLTGALASALERHGERHATVAVTRNNLGAVIGRQGRIDEAERLFRQALGTRRSLFGPTHLEVAETLNNLAGIEKSRGRIDEAVDLMRDTLRIRRALLAPDHPLVFQSASNLAVMLGTRGDPAEAESLLREAVDRARRVLGRNHPDLISMVGNLGAILVARKRYKEAGPWLREAVRIGKRTLRPDNPRLVTARLRLGDFLIRVRQFGSAERLLLGLHRTVARQGGAALQRAVARKIVELYDHWDRPEQAAEWRTG